MSNQRLVDELTRGGVFSDEKGYWKARGYTEFPGWEHLPFADFFENLSSKSGHKKMWLNPDGSFKEGRLSYSSESLMSLYEGIKETQMRIVSAGFFTYSCLIVNLHLRLAFYSRKLGVSPDITSILEVADEEACKDLEYRALALRCAAYLIYEGDGLGGYRDKVWLLWGRIFGIACPDNPEVLPVEEAEESSDLWDSSSDTKRKELFLRWWSEIDESHNSLDPLIVGHIYTGYKLYRRYQQMENPNCREQDLFDPKSTLDVQAAICGFFRRSAGGQTEAKAYDINDVMQTPHRFVDLLSVAFGKFKALVTGKEGKPTPFGSYLITLHSLTLRRVELIKGVVARQDVDQLTYDQYLREGKATRVAKRGRIRR